MWILTELMETNTFQSLKALADILCLTTKLLPVADIWQVSSNKFHWCQHQCSSWCCASCHGLLSCKYRPKLRPWDQVSSAKTCSQHSSVYRNVVCFFSFQDLWLRCSPTRSKLRCNWCEFIDSKEYGSLSKWLKNAYKNQMQLLAWVLSNTHTLQATSEIAMPVSSSQWQGITAPHHPEVAAIQELYKKGQVLQVLKGLVPVPYQFDQGYISNDLSVGWLHWALQKKNQQHYYPCLWLSWPTTGCSFPPPRVLTPSWT